MRAAREAGVLVSVDVNLRPSFWRDQKEMRAVALEAAEEADVLKVSEEELTIMAGVADIEEGLARLWRPRRRLIAVTLGARGALRRLSNSAFGRRALPLQSSTRWAAATPLPRAFSPTSPHLKLTLNPNPDWSGWRVARAPRAP